MNKICTPAVCADTGSKTETIGRFSYDEYLAAVESFHG